LTDGFQQISITTASPITICPYRTGRQLRHSLADD